MLCFNIKSDVRKILKIEIGFLNAYFQGWIDLKM